MPPKCSICIRPDRAEIDQALVSGVSVRSLETRHQGTTRSAIDRHRRHIPAALAQAKQAAEVADATTVLSRVECLASQCQRMLDRAERGGKLVAWSNVARELRGCLELLAKISGELQPAAARVAITFNEIQNLNVAALTREQVGLIYDRIEAERIREIERMSNAEIERQLADLLGLDVPLLAGSKNLLGNERPAIPQTIDGA